METTVEDKWACLQRREWNSGPFGAIERFPGELFAVRATSGPERKGRLFFLYFGLEEHHPRWGARASTLVWHVYSRPSVFDSCLFRHSLL